MNSQSESGSGKGTGESSSGTGGAFAQARQAVSQAAQTVKKTATDTVARAREEGEKLATQKKEAAAARVGGYSTALRESARSLEEQDPNIASFANQAADKIQGVADYVRQSDFSTLRHDAERFARRNPAVFYGGLFVAGLFLGNVVKASQRGQSSSGDDGRSEDGGSDHQSGNPADQAAQSSVTS